MARKNAWLYVERLDDNATRAIKRALRDRMEAQRAMSRFYGRPPARNSNRPASKLARRTQKASRRTNVRYSLSRTGGN